MPSAVEFSLVSMVLCLVQMLAALPWALALDFRLRGLWLKFSTWWKALLACAGVGVGLGIILDANSDATLLRALGRFYFSILHLQMAADFLVAGFAALLWLWPKGGAVAFSAFREGIRQPMFWMLGLAAFFLMLISPIIPYFTFGEDLKMVIELCYAFAMLAPALFGVIAASMSVSEEIEGRTAVTLMSKPVSRRQFLIGKFGGLLLASLFMTVLLGWVLVWIVIFGQWYIRLPGQPDTPDPNWVVEISQALFPQSNVSSLVQGFGLWLYESGTALPGLIIGFGQVMVLLAIAVALATRLPMVVNLPICMLVYFLGHLTSIMTEVSQEKYRLIYFVAQLFDTLLPGLDLFDVGTAVVREAPLPPLEYAFYTFNVSLYAVVYTTIALLFGLILFEDRDLA